MRISEWAHIVNATMLPGPGIIEALSLTAESEEVGKLVKEGEEGKEGKAGMGRGMLILAEMTSKGSLATGEYTRASVEVARRFPKFVIGFVSTRSLSHVEPEKKGDEKEDFVLFTTGVNMSTKGDKLGQQYNTPRKAVIGGADFIISGRGVYAAEDRVEAAVRYKTEGWDAYLERTGQK